MTESDIEYWCGEIGSSIVGCYDRMGIDETDYEVQEELQAIRDICDLALQSI